MITIKHLYWIIPGIMVAFLSSFIFADLLDIPRDLYYLIYFVIILSFLIFYIRKTNLHLKKWFSRRLVWGIILGIIFAILMIQNVLSRPETAKLHGTALFWALVWRGLLYGTVDGLILTVFPWVVTWRAFRAEEKNFLHKIGIGLIAALFILAMTTLYHLGYRDFRSPKIIQANIGNTIMSVPTLLSANPIGTPIVHATLHITAVLHSPETDLFLPPHRPE
ncbi:MAG: hypothetical protein EH225_04945 [Calditrichaeota bacterium]|nr:hypothetical protein [Calditrichota bacterium]RQW05076.1 MAG: hypothetical protein EH225_04945 [Calditrichota bacterium]